MAILSPGQSAPDFELPVDIGKTLTLRSQRGRYVVLAFYPADFSPVCGDQLVLYNEALDEFRDLGAKMLGISCDGIFCHRAFTSQRKLKFPLLSDFEPKGAVSKMYGVYDSRFGQSERALFVIDGDGIIRWSHVSPVDVNPGAHGILSALEELNQNETRSA
jgi:peroxiredoxin